MLSTPKWSVGIQAVDKAVTYGVIEKGPTDIHTSQWEVAVFVTDWLTDSPVTSQSVVCCPQDGWVKQKQVDSAVVSL